MNRWSDTATDPIEDIAREMRRLRDMPAPTMDRESLHWQALAAARRRGGHIALTRAHQRHARIVRVTSNRLVLDAEERAYPGPAPKETGRKFLESLQRKRGRR